MNIFTPNRQYVSFALLCAAYCFIFGCSPHVSSSAEKQHFHIPVLLYHHISPKQKGEMYIPPDQFADHLRTIKNRGYRTLSLDELYHIMTTGSMTSPPAVMITFDDAWRSVYTNALPLLKKYRMRATIFVNTAAVGTRHYMTWSDLREAKRYGCDIGNHSHRHPNLLNRSLDRQSCHIEINNPLKIIRKQLGAGNYRYFSYPFGGYSQNLFSIVGRRHLMAFSVDNTPVSELTPRFTVPRFLMVPERRLESVLSTIPLRFRRISPMPGEVFAHPPRQLFTRFAPPFPVNGSLQLIIHYHNNDIAISPKSHHQQEAVFSLPRSKLKRVNQITLTGKTDKGAPLRFGYLFHIISKGRRHEYPAYQ